MRRPCWLLLLLLVTAPLAARADGFALAKQGFQAQKQGQWDEAIRLYGAALDAGDLDDKGKLLVMGLRANALGIRGRGTLRASRPSRNNLRVRALFLSARRPAAYGGCSV